MAERGEVTEPLDPAEGRGARGGEHECPSGRRLLPTIGNGTIGHQGEDGDALLGDRQPHVLRHLGDDLADAQIAERAGDHRAAGHDGIVGSTEAAGAEHLVEPNGRQRRGVGGERDGESELAAAVHEVDGAWNRRVGQPDRAVEVEDSGRVPRQIELG